MSTLATLHFVHNAVILYQVFIARRYLCNDCKTIRRWAVHVGKVKIVHQLWSSTQAIRRKRWQIFDRIYRSTFLKKKSIF